MKPGDKVIFIHEKGGGIIRRIEHDVAWVETDQGIEIPFPLSELIIRNLSTEKSKPIQPANKEKNTTKKAEIKSDTEIDWNVQKKNIPKVKDPDFTVDMTQIGESHHQTKKFTSAREEVWEIDLHIHELMDDFERLSNGEILEIQLKHFRAFMNKALEKRIKKVIIIHGVGTGRLKAEIIAESTKYPTQSVHDAPLKKYGKGATEIILRQNF